MMVVDLDRRGYHKEARNVSTPGFITRARLPCPAILLRRKASSMAREVTKLTAYNQTSRLDIVVQSSSITGLPPMKSGCAGPLRESSRLLIG